MVASPVTFQKGCRCTYSVLRCFGSLLRRIHFSKETGVLGMQQFLSIVFVFAPCQPAHLMLTVPSPFLVIFLYWIMSQTGIAKLKADVRICRAYHRLSTSALTPDLSWLRSRVAALLSISYPVLTLWTLACFRSDSTSSNTCLLLQSKLLFNEVTATVSRAPRCGVVPIFLNRRELGRSLGRPLASSRFICSQE